MTSERKARHALFEGFEETIDAKRYLDDPNILGRTCLATVKSGKHVGEACPTRCVKMERSATELWDSLSATAVIEDKEKLIKKVELFIKASHCGNHGRPKRVRDGLQKWQKDQLARYLLSSNVKSEVTAGRTPSQDSLTDCSYGEEMDCTTSPGAAVRGRGVSDEGESFEDTATTLEAHPATEKISSTNSTIHKISISSKIAPDSAVIATVLIEQKIEVSSTEATQMMSGLTIKEEARLPHLIGEPKPTLTNDASKRRLRKPRAAEVKNIGTVNPTRSVSVRDNSGVVREFHKPFTADDKKEGILYVLAKTNAPGIFKIGWSTLSAEQRLKHPKNCYAEEAEIIYESPTAFHGAHRAETCAHTYLKNKRLKVTNCVYCGNGHREYFEAPKADVLCTVMLVEYILRLPGYVDEGTEKGWKLSDEANEIIHEEFKTALAIMERAVEQKMAPKTALANEMLESESINTSNNTTTSLQHSESGEQVIQEQTTGRSLGERVGSRARELKDKSSSVFRRSLTAERNKAPSTLPKTAPRSILNALAEGKARAEAAVEKFRADFEAGYAQATSPK